MTARRRGLGTFYVQDSSGNTVDCDSWSNFFNSACWGLPGMLFGGSGGTPLTATGQVDCSQMENWVNGKCSLGSWILGNPLLVIGAAVGLFVVVKVVEHEI